MNHALKTIALIAMMIVPACARLQRATPLPQATPDVTTYDVAGLGFSLVDDADPKRVVYDRLIDVWNGEPAAMLVETEKRRARGEAQVTAGTAEKASDAVAPIFISEAGARAAFVALAFLSGAPALADSAGASWLHRRVIEVATSHPAFTGGELQPLVTNAPTDVIAYTRGDVVVVVNTRPRDIAVTVHGRMLHRARDLIHGWVQSGETIMLSPFGTAVLDARAR